MRYIFGPVPSRRLGRSLGVDVVPFKTCSYDCIYCQLGHTTHQSVHGSEWVTLDDVVDELRERLSSEPDYITISGSGEPTLYARLGELIDRIRSMTAVPVAVLTNGSLLWLPEVRKALAEAQLVIPSLDAGTAEMFEAVNRPHPSLSFQQMIDGLITFSTQYQGRCWLEVMILAGHTAVLAEVRRIARWVRKIRPQRVQLNTVTRPPCEDYAVKVNGKRLRKIALMFDPPAEVIADFRDIHRESGFTATRESVRELLMRRPCSVADIAAGLGLHRNEVVKYVEELLALDRIRLVESDREDCYRAVPEGMED